MTGTVAYRTDLFDRTTILRLRGSWRSLLARVAAAPDQPLSELPLLTGAAQRQLLVEWNDTASPYPREATIHQLFEARAAATPEAVALVFVHAQVSYRELNRRANRLAHHLRAHGVGPDVCVGMCVERSVEMLVAILGILKAGGAYVPLDPSYPAERLAFMVEDIGTPVLVAGAGLLERLPAAAASAQLRCIRLDAERAALAGTSPENPTRTAAAQNLAYVMYTSGSTGRPKGVSVVHRGVVRLVRETNYAALSAREVLLQFAPISFDASTLEIWGALLNGGRLVVLPPQMPSLLELGRLLRRHRVTTLWITTGLFHKMVDEELAALGSVRQILTGGEVLSAARARRLLAEHPGCALTNFYGPTEATTFTSYAPLPRADAVDDSVPIGRPISATRVYVCDRRGRPVPVGVYGELWVGDDGLARGYWKRPQRTAASFVPSPVGEVAGARLYRTGDLVRHLADGRLEFLGRRDHQVKVRGFRIELGEVEAVLAAHPGVRECAVVVCDDGAGDSDKRLVAFVVPRSTPGTAAAELRERVRAKLPDYMVPGAFAELEALPLGPTGKVDRAALARSASAQTRQSSEQAPFGAEEEWVAPRTPAEEMMVGLWSHVLHGRRIGVHDDFFALGGHSLLAAQIASRASAAFAVEIGPQLLFERPTVAALAAEIEKLRAARQGIPIEPLRPIDRSRPLPLSFAQERLWFLQQLEPASTAYNITEALHFTGSLAREALRRAFEEIVRRHEVLRTTFAIVGEQPRQRISPAGEHPLPLVDLRALRQEDRRPQVELRKRSEETRPVDLARGPLLRTILLRMAADEHVLLVCGHHIGFDGWSMGIVARELATLYRALAAGDDLRTRPAPLAPLPIQVADHAAWQRRRLSGDELERQLAWWRERLDSPPPAARLAVDHPRSEGEASRAARSRFELSAPTSEALRELSRSEGATLFMTLLAVFQTLLHRHTGGEAVAVGTPIATRNRPEIETLIGFFVNTQVLRTSFRGNPSFRRLLDQVRETTLGAYAHQEMPFERLVEALQPDRRSEGQPLFQVLFALQNAPMEPLSLPGVTFKLLEVDAGTRSAQFDLTLGIMERQETLTGILDYDGTLFEPATIEVLSDHFRRLADEIAADPDRPVGDLRLSSESERRQILEEWSRIDPSGSVWAEIRDRITAAEAASGEAPRVCVLDPELRPVPCCGVGEIYLEAAAAAAGSIPHPFAAEPGRGLLATGMRGRWRADGRLELPDAARRERAPADAAAASGEEAAEDQQVTAKAAAHKLRRQVSDRRGRLSDAKRALLARRLRGRAKQAPPVEGIPRRPAGDGPARLSLVQEQLWFIDQLNPGGVAYNMPLPLRLQGRIDPAILAATFARILERHEVLRATFRAVDGEPVMEIAPLADSVPALVDLTALAGAERDEVVQRLIHADVNRPFDLARGPLIRLTLVRLADEDHVMLFAVHHIVFDGWSSGVLVRELTVLYHDLAAARSASGTAPAGLQELPIQYADFAHWQRERLRGEGVKRQLEYWRRQLADAATQLELPCDRPRPIRPRFRGRGREVRFPEALFEPLNALGRRQDATLFMTMLAAFKALLYRHSGQTDLVVGTPIAGRNREELESLIGFLVNTLALRTELSAAARDLSFLELLTRVRDVAMDAYAQQDVPFEQVVREVDPERSGGGNPLFQVMFVLQTTSSGSVEDSGIMLSQLSTAWGTAKFDLSMLLTAEGTEGMLEYDRDLFDATTMDRLVAHFTRLLAAIAEDPERRLGDLPLVAAAERHQLLAAWNDTGAPLPRVAGVVELWRAQAARTPERVALVAGGRQVSYRELERRSNRLAHHLQGLGVGPEVPVGMAIERSVDLVAAMLGVFKSGGFLVPLDRSLPGERLAFIIEDAGLQVILTRRDSHAHLPAHGAHTVYFEDLPETRERERERKRERGAALADNLAYLIYTSGTTGRPKGISMPHQVLTNLTRWQLRSTAPDAGMRTPQFAPLSFDIIFQETFSTLCAGGTLVLLTEEERRDAVLLTDRLEQHRIERLYLPFIALQQLCEVTADRPPRALREVITAGEQLQVSRPVERFFTNAACTLENQYGPSECHVVTCYPLHG
ncbi:MAG: amino acid adenylation domain-containing protein, partial [bacterium]|nr:amino acid adenylation domain-containing protein [bacterium]